MRFKNILIPVETLSNDDLIIAKLIEFHESSATTFHLVFTVKKTGWITFLTPKKIKSYPNNYLLAEERFKILENKIRERIPGCKLIRKIIIEGNIITNKIIIESSATAATLQEYIKRSNIDLVLVCKHKKTSLYDFCSQKNYIKIAKRTGCNVFWIPANETAAAFKSIIIPIDFFIPERKIKLAIGFAKKYGCKIYLIGYSGSNDSLSKNKRIAFFETYSTLKLNGLNPFYKILSGYDSEDILREFIYIINADLVLLTPGKDSFISNCLKYALKDPLHQLSALYVADKTKSLSLFS